MVREVPPEGGTIYELLHVARRESRHGWKQDSAKQLGKSWEYARWRPDAEHLLLNVIRNNVSPSCDKVVPFT